MIIESLLKEMEREAEITRRVLERVPEEKLGWKPHQKSMTLGELVLHIATAQGNLARMMSCDTYDLAEYVQQTASTRAGLLEAFESGTGEAVRILSGFDDAALGKTWTVTRGGQTMMSMPRGAAIRFVMMNHVYHHRGQLSVYLRLLEVPVPAMYGPSADENPWAK